MNEAEDSFPESDHIPCAEVASMENLFQKTESLDEDHRDRKYSRKYNVTEEHVEEKNSFKWIPNQTKLSKELTKRSQKKNSHVHTDAAMSTLESDRTSSSYTVSDFISNVYTKNGYIRCTSPKKCSQESSSAFKYNEFSTLISTLGTGRNFPVEIKPENAEPKKEKRSPCLNEEYTIFLILGGIQTMLGILMAVFGVLVIAHDSSLSGSGSGLWGGAVAMFSGLMGILAGLKVCYANDKQTKASRTLLTIFFAFCLVSFALSNLVVVLTATGLIRDIRRSKNQATEIFQENFMNWPPVLADVGLILASALQCVAAVFSGYKCYKKVCSCFRNNHSRLSDTTSHKEGRYKIENKERFVNNWLGQQFRMPKKSKCEGQNHLIQWGTPNIVLLPPPPPMITNGQIPILTFLQAPSSVFDSAQIQPRSVPCCCHRDNYHTTSYPIVHEKKLSRKMAYIQPDSQILPKTKNRCRKKERRASLPTAEEVARTYTGLDREIAEEFIAIAMNKGRKSRQNSFAEFGNNY